MKLFCEHNDNHIIFSNKHQNQHLFDSWSFIHINHAFILFTILELYFSKENAILISLIISIVFEFIENSSFGHNLMRKNGYPKYKGDTVINIIGDIISDIIGLYIGYKISFIEESKRMFYWIMVFVILELIPYNISKETVIYCWLNLFKYNI